MSIQPTWLHCRLAFAPGSGVIHVVVVNFDALAQALCKRYSNLKETSCIPLLKAGFQPRSLKAPNPQPTECPLTNRLRFQPRSLKAPNPQPTIEDQAKNFKSTACPYDEWTFNPLDFTAVWLWHLALALYMLLLLISMLWHRQAIFESKGDKLSSSDESRIPTWKSQGT